VPVHRATSTTTDLDRISNHIELLRAAFRNLSRAATLKDLGRQFAEVVGQMFTQRTIDLAHRKPDSKTWDELVNGSAEGMAMIRAHPVGKLGDASEISQAAGTITLVHRLTDDSIIGLTISGTTNAKGYSEVDVLSLKLFVALFDSAYQDVLFRKSEKNLIFSLNHRILQLNSLVDTGIEVSTLDENSSPHRLALMRAASLTNASAGVVRVRRGEELLEEYAFPEGAGPAETTVAGNRINTSFTFSSDTFSFELFDKESRSGTVAFEDTDQLLLDALARQVHASLENRYLHQQALEKQRIEQEMTVAATIQKRIIPVSLPAIPGYDVAGTNIPSKSVGGDYYDCIRFPDGRYALVVADVTGKGVPAALLVSSLHAYLSAYLELSNTLCDLLGKLNKALYAATTDDKFVTAFIAVLSPETGEIEFSSAGHNPAYLLKAGGTVEEVNLGGPPLGAVDLGIPYLSGRMTINKGERLLLYTDGVTEAMNEKNELYERKNSLPDFLAQHKSDRAESFIANLIADVRTFTGSAPQNDDITVLYLCRND
jgi:serine phosphatase RsbU (regulator of sigma subunit)